MFAYNNIKIEDLQIDIFHLKYICILLKIITMSQGFYFMQTKTCAQQHCKNIFGINSNYLSLQTCHYTVRKKGDFDSFIKTKN